MISSGVCLSLSDLFHSVWQSLGPSMLLQIFHSYQWLSNISLCVYIHITPHLLYPFICCLHIFSSVQFSFSVVSNSLRPYGLQHARPPCPSPTPRAYSNSCPLSRWCHPAISSSAVPFSSCLQSFPASGSFPMSLFFASGGQRIRVSASASVLPMNFQDWFPLGWTGWIPLQSKGLSPTPQFKSINSLALRFLYSLTLTSIHDHCVRRVWKSK